MPAKQGSASWLCWRSGLSRCRSCSFLLTTEQSSSRTHGQDPGQDQQSPRSHSGRGSICFTMSLSNTFSEAFCCSWSPGNGVRLPGSGFRPPLPPSSRWAGRSRRCWLLYRSAFFSVSWSSEAARCSTRSCSTGCSASVPTYFRFTTRNFSSPEPPGLGTGTYSRAHRVARFLGENHWTKITGSGIGRSRSNWYHRQFRVNVELDDSPTHL